MKVAGNHPAAWRCTSCLVAQVLKASHVEPRALAVCFTARARAVTAVRVLRDGFPRTPIFARALDSRHAAEMKDAGADNVVIANAESGAALASGILASKGVNSGQVSQLSGMLRQQMDHRAQGLVQELAKEDTNISSDDDIFRLDESLLPLVRYPPAAQAPFRR